MQPHSVAVEGRQQIRIADEYESISDYIVDLDKFDRKLRRDGYRFNADQRARLQELHNHVSEFLTAVNEGFVQNNSNIVTQTDAMSKRVRDEIKMLRTKHMDELSSGEFPPAVSVAWLASLTAYALVRDHSQNVAEAVAGEK